MCLPLIGRKSTTYLQKLLVFHLSLFSRQVVYSYLALSMRFTCKTKKTTQTKNIKFGSLSLSLSLSLVFNLHFSSSLRSLDSFLAASVITMSLPHFLSTTVKMGCGSVYFLPFSSFSFLYFEI